jgi:hypothetical protein
MPEKPKNPPPTKQKPTQPPFKKTGREIIAERDSGGPKNTVILKNKK